jgi:hypothetical protein
MAYLQVRWALCWVVEVAMVTARIAKTNAADASIRHWPALILGVAFRTASSCRPARALRRVGIVPADLRDDLVPCRAAPSHC